MTAAWVLAMMVSWAIPILIILWFVRRVRDIQTSLRRIERRLESLSPDDSMTF